MRRGNHAGVEKRLARPPHAPELGELRGSGTLEQNAHVRRGERRERLENRRRSVR
jgi:hypothetical protein